MNENLTEIKNRELRETKAKTEDGGVYGNIDGKVGFHFLGNYLFKKGLSLFKYIDKLERKNAELEKTVEALTKAELLTNERLSEVERKLAIYGLE